MTDRPKAAERKRWGEQARWVLGPMVKSGYAPRKAELAEQVIALVAALDEAEARANENEFDAKMALPECQEELARVKARAERAEQALDWLKYNIYLADKYSERPFRV